MPYLLLAILGAILLFWLVLKLKEADRKTLESSFKFTLTLLLVLFGIYCVLTERIGFVAAAALALVYLYAPKISRYFRKSPEKFLPKDMGIEEAAQILGISQDASEAEIQAAYHRLIAKNHPDHGGSKYIAQQLNQARELLIEKIKQKN
ncbi:DnaJ domain-containing protein [Candidatus Bealeia paramacronuclearis]|uniref:DnaJ domain-containing protein n=1 Tax=Candidatus Bealeia paramacronuclearis TaxID=1921001 RepID=A0ABZ2C648_9PROT|nr:DnaJ domain-containing protein [Candidatus Bealeia paramacronuclearis]